MPIVNPFELSKEELLEAYIAKDREYRELVECVKSMLPHFDANTCVPNDCFDLRAIVSELRLKVNGVQSQITPVANTESKSEEMDDLDRVIHSGYYDVFDRRTPDKYLIARIKSSLPSSILSDAKEWGAFDTVVRENVFCWIRDNKKSFT